MKTKPDQVEIKKDFKSKKPDYWFSITLVLCLAFGVVLYGVLLSAIISYFSYAP